MAEIRVLLVDDHKILREGIQAMLALDEVIQVVGEARDGAEALERVGELQPDVVLMDIAMEKMNGLEATRQITQKYPGVAVLVLSQHEERQYVLPIFQAGAAGYVLKRTLGKDLINAIQAVARGEVYLDANIGSILVGELRSRDAKRRAPAEALSQREREVLNYLVEGLSNSQIAEKIHISENTVKKHLGSILEKLHLNNRVEVAVYAVREGLVGNDH